MADFVGKDEAVAPGEVAEATAAPVAVATPFVRSLPEVMINAADALTVQYCGVCSMPPEFCEYGACYDRCREWIQSNCPDMLSISSSLAAASVSSSGEPAAAAPKPKGGGAAAPKKLATMQTRILISRIQRQRKKFITAVVGLDTIPETKIKDIAKLFGKKFSSGASVGETATGAKEVTIQGDVSFDIPPLLVQEYKVDPTCIFYADGNNLTPYA
eukprot:gene2296-1678_t